MLLLESLQLQTILNASILQQSVAILELLKHLLEGSDL
jgi:hypothetical protein